MKLAVVSALSVLGLAACAAPPTAPSALAYNSDASATVPARQCFRSTQINGHRFADPQTLYLRVGLRDYYRVQTTANCNTGIDPRQTLVTKTTGGSDMVCSPIDFDLKVRQDGGFITPCIVRSITPLTPQEVAALPKKLKP
jgi:hypothetical protein